MERRASVSSGTKAVDGFGAPVPGMIATQGDAGDSSSIDSQFTDAEYVKFLEACIECDDDLLYDIIQDGVTWDEVNERDKSGRVSNWKCL